MNLIIEHDQLCTVCRNQRIDAYMHKSEEKSCASCGDIFYLRLTIRVTQNAALFLQAVFLTEELIMTTQIDYG